MAFYEIMSWTGTLEVKKFQDDEKAREYVKTFPEYLKADFRRITENKAEKIERKTAEGLAKIVFRYNLGNKY